MKKIIITEAECDEYVQKLQCWFVIHITATSACVVVCGNSLYEIFGNQHPIFVIGLVMGLVGGCLNFWGVWINEEKLQNPLKYYIQQRIETEQNAPKPKPEKYHVFVADDGTYTIKEE